MGSVPRSRSDGRVLRRWPVRPGSVSGRSSGLSSTIPPAEPILGPGQRDLPFSPTSAREPLYTAGRPLCTIDSAHVQFGAEQSEEFRTALDLKLTVSEAFAALPITQPIWA
jgi:hypothetical protein